MSTISNVPVEVAAAAIARLIIYALVLAGAARVLYRFPSLTVALVLAVIGAVLTLYGQREIAAIVSMPTAGLTAWVYVQRIREDSSTLRAHLAAQEAAWSRERHELTNQVMSERARRILAEKGAG